MTQGGHKRRRRLPAPVIEKIVDYWSARQDECGLGVDWAEAHERCWRCGYQRRLERCHIVPDSLGGSNDPGNFVLLCSRCHVEAPNVADARFMWLWLRSTAVPFYDMFWQLRAVREFEDMFGRKPFDLPEFTNEHQTQLQREIQELMQKATIHFGHPHFNASTLACLYALAEELALGKLPEGQHNSRNADYLLEVIGWKKRQE